ncbi:MAG: thioesterase family protein [Hyphomicrobiales bacterium]|nr:thioesterase family protein [Hyphomicrobiales bacterium]
MAGFVETYRAVVAPEELDHLGHMNVQHYMAALSDAAFSLMTEMGMGVRTIERTRIGIAAVHMDISFLREIHLGAVVVMESAVAAVDGRKVRFLHRLRDAETGEVCMSARVLGVVMDLEKRKACELPPEVRERTRAMAVGDGALDESGEG